MDLSESASLASQNRCDFVCKSDTTRVGTILKWNTAHSNFVNSHQKMRYVLKICTHAYLHSSKNPGRYNTCCDAGIRIRA